MLRRDTCTASTSELTAGDPSESAMFRCSENAITVVRKRSSDRRHAPEYGGYSIRDYRRQSMHTRTVMRAQGISGEKHRPIYTARNVIRRLQALNSPPQCFARAASKNGPNNHLSSPYSSSFTANNFKNLIIALLYNF